MNSKVMFMEVFDTVINEKPKTQNVIQKVPWL